jgi:VIT1/CCC1 family predicted Fe2+/Mn2+ transporter
MKYLFIIIAIAAAFSFSENREERIQKQIDALQLQLDTRVMPETEQNSIKLRIKNLENSLSGAFEPLPENYSLPIQAIMDKSENQQTAIGVINAGGNFKTAGALLICGAILPVVSSVAYMKSGSVDLAIGLNVVALGLTIGGFYNIISAGGKMENTDR